MLALDLSVRPQVRVRLRLICWILILGSYPNSSLICDHASTQDPFVMGVSPERGPKAGGTLLTITGRRLLTGRPSDLAVTVGGVPCSM